MYTCLSFFGVAIMLYAFSFFWDKFQRNLLKRLSQGRKHEKTRNFVNILFFFRIERGRYFIYFGVRPATLVLAFSHVILL